jgi:hypothetical protein
MTASAYEVHRERHVKLESVESMGSVNAGEQYVRAFALLLHVLLVIDSSPPLLLPPVLRNTTCQCAYKPCAIV